MFVTLSLSLSTSLMMFLSYEWPRHDLCWPQVPDPHLLSVTFGWSLEQRSEFTCWSPQWCVPQHKEQTDINNVKYGLLDQCLITLWSLHDHFTITSWSLDDHWTIISQSLHDHCTITSRSLHDHFTITEWSVHDHDFTCSCWSFCCCF